MILSAQRAPCTNNNSEPGFGVNPRPFLENPKLRVQYSRNMTLVDRPEFLRALREALSRSPAVALLGPRQCGKSTLARTIAAEVLQATYLDLERPADLERLKNPELTLAAAPGLVVLDEIQRKPELFEVLRVLVDRSSAAGRFLALGSASLDVVKGASESLAGRVSFVDLTGFRLGEVEDAPRLWLRGGFPRSYLAESEAASVAWREDFVRTFLERDIPQLGINIPAATLRRFWTMVAHFHGQIWNASELARSLGTSENTARRYLDLLTGAYMIRQLPPWFENLKKRQVKSPKVYVRDSGLLHTLLTLETAEQLSGHPKVGASWEGYVIEQLLVGLGSRDVYFWATHAGAELDLFARIGGKRYGFEIKYTDAPRTTRSMRTAQADLELERLFLIYPGEQSYPLDDGIDVLPISEVARIRERLR